jgi:hypothetical protein
MVEWPSFQTVLKIRKKIITGSLWLMPVIPATQEAEIRRIEVQIQPGQIDSETLLQK